MWYYETPAELIIYVHTTQIRLYIIYYALLDQYIIPTVKFKMSFLVYNKLTKMITTFYLKFM